MAPLTHLLASWIVAAHTTDNLRDRRLVSLAGIAPDLDGVGIFLDMANGSFARGNLFYYPEYHHWLMHGLPAALVCCALLAFFAERKARVFALAMLVFHLHLLCDLVGSRGPSPSDLWPIFYFGPISRTPMLIWSHQWGLDAWPNRILSILLFAWAFCLSVKLGDSIVGVFNRRADRAVVPVLRKLAAGWRAIR
ncbi:MAG TPA: metal-dependent hydrolase [Verrucomicrobiae bacterium]|nr:metal-dependent hydrolase [Verrucomicrobiae bacterium]